ncbi:MAG: hypothetical protein FJ308_00385 [Planctomycetes bacterium]|nr:hypothetical protein [Planctomycetota bacterium]
MPDARTMHSPYPPGQGAASVPVLFTLPNVQPVIAAASVKQEEIARTASLATELPKVDSTLNPASNTDTGSAAGAVSPIAPNVYGKKAPGSGSKIGHVTNALIGVLLLAVVSLTIRNFAPTHSNSGNNNNTKSVDSTAKLIDVSESVPAVSSAPLPSTGSATVGVNPVAPGVSSGTSALLVASKPSGIRQSDSSSPRGNAVVDAAAAVDATTDTVAGTPEKNQESSSADRSAAAIADDLGDGTKENVGGSTSAAPSVPMLLPSKEPKSALGGGASLQHPQPSNDRALVTQAPASGPYGSTATTSATAAPSAHAVTQAPANLEGNTTADNAAIGKPSLSSQTKSNVSLTSGPNRYVGNSASGVPNAVDSDTPSLNTRDMINLRNGQRTSKGVVGGTTTVRNPNARGQEAMNPTQSMLMSGETYPPIRKQYEPINIPSNGAQAPSAYQPVYQPSLQPNTVLQPGVATSGVATSGQGAVTTGNVIAQPRIPYTGSSPSLGGPAVPVPNSTPQRPLQPYTPLTPTLPLPGGTGLAPSTPNR